MAVVLVALVLCVPLVALVLPVPLVALVFRAPLVVLLLPLLFLVAPVLLRPCDAVLLLDMSD